MMASTSTSLRISITLQSRKPLFPTALTSSFRPRQPPSRSAGLSCFGRRRDSDKLPLAPKKTSKKKAAKKEVAEDEDIEEDAFEALFRQLEEDLKNDGLIGDDGEDDDISEEELAKLEQELAEALEDDDLLVALGSAALGGIINEDEDEEGEEEEEEEEVDEDIDVTNNKDGKEEVDKDIDVTNNKDGKEEVDKDIDVTNNKDGDDGDEVDDDDDEEEEEEEEMPVKLKNWQLRRLAYALKDGRRKTSIKNLAADLCLDRAVVLSLLRDPPPNLVMLSATLPDKPAKIVSKPVEKLEEEDVPLETTTDTAKPEVEVKEPIHVMQSNWSARKRLKKVQIETLEQVYRKSKRPTNAMISSIVHVTNLPRKRVVKWFEDKRAEDGVPEQRVTYEPRASESAVTS